MKSVTTGSLMLGLLATMVWPTFLLAQTIAHPEIGYTFPPGGRAGETVDVVLGTYNVTPDAQFFLLGDDGVRLEITGMAGPLLLHGAPYFSGPKGYRPLPLPREIPARLHLPADLPVGRVRWQIANANGASNLGTFLVSYGVEVVEEENNPEPQLLAALPVTVSGRLVDNEEVDRFAFRSEQSGPVTCDLVARRLGSPMLGMIEVHDDTGRFVADVMDSAGLDAQLTFFAEADRAYIVSVRDLDFRGHRSFVYRLNVRPGGRVLATLPVAGRKGETCEFEFVGIGLATGKAKLERRKYAVEFPTELDLETFDYRLKTPFGHVPVSILVSELPQILHDPGDSHQPKALEVPVGITGIFSGRSNKHQYRFESSQGQRWSINAMARRIRSPLDVLLTVAGPDGKTFASSDDLPGTTDAGVEFSAPADGLYEITVKDLAGQRSSCAVYYIAIESPPDDFLLEFSQQRIDVQIGGKAELELNVQRRGSFDGTIDLKVHGLPAEIKVPPDMVVPLGEKQFKIPLESAENTSSLGFLIEVTGTAEIGDATVTRVARAPSGNVALRSREETLVSSILVASTMKPVCAVRPEESDERTVHRGSTHLGGVLFERSNGFSGSLLVQMAGKQPAKFRQGAMGPDTILPPGTSYFYYPLFMPEGLETFDAYRISLNAVAQVTDPRGNRRHLVTTFPSDVSFGITIEGALLRLSHQVREMTVESGQPFELPIKISRSPKLTGPLKLELRPPPKLVGRLSAEPLEVSAGRDEVLIAIASATGLEGEHTLTIRATALVHSEQIPEIVELTYSPLDPDLQSYLKTGCLPIVSETRVPIRFEAAATGG